MADSFTETKEIVGNEIDKLTRENIEKLSEKWIETFELEICEDNLKKLSEHASIFYNEVLCETIDRQNVIKSNIKELKEEASLLCRLLHVNFDTSLYRDMPLFTIKNRLNEDLQGFREKLMKRRSEICDLLLEQETLCEELGENPKPLLDDPLPSEDELQEFRIYLQNMKSEKMNRLCEVAALRKEIKNYLSVLETTIENEDDNILITERHIPVNTISLNRLRELRDIYKNQHEEMHEAIDSMKMKLVILWDCLDTSASIRQKYSKYTDYTQTVFDKLYRELDRCKAEKLQNIKKFVDKIREEILIWWDKTLKSDKERNRFSNFTSDCYTEDLLALHEMELDDIKNFYFNNEKIFQLISERKTLWERMNALEIKASDPGRYNNRGGQLLKEEKERKTIATKLPKIEEDLKDLVNAYEKRHNKKFLVYGEDILDIISREWEKKREEKELVMSARKKNVINTPLSKYKQMTPMSTRTHTTTLRGGTSTIKATPSTPYSYLTPRNIKRKHDIDNNVEPHAKRSILSEFGASKLTTTKQTKPKNSSARKACLAAGILKTKIRRVSNNAKNRRKSRITNRTMPKIMVTENSLASETVTYNNFEEYIDKDPSSRSSIMEVKRPNKIRNLQKSVINRLPDPRQALTPLKINKDITKKSPTVSRTISPVAGSSSRKLTTKNLPIII